MTQRDAVAAQETLDLVIHEDQVRRDPSEHGGLLAEDDLNYHGVVHTCP